MDLAVAEGGGSVAPDRPAEEVLPVSARGLSSARAAICGRLMTLGSMATLSGAALWSVTAPSPSGLTPYAIGTLALGLGMGCVGLVMSRRAAQSSAALWVIDGALRAYDSGERDSGALRVNPSLGELAESWNGILDEREAARRADACRRAGDAAAARDDGAEMLNASFESISQGILILDSRLMVTRCNGAARVLLGLPEETPLPVSLTEWIDEERVIDSARDVASGKSRPEATELESESGSVLKFGFRPLRRDDRAAALVLVDDVTQRRMAERSRDAFVAQATHELRAPLTNIRLYVEEAIEDGVSERDRIEALQVINRESRRLERTISDMLSVSEIEAGTLTLREAEVRLDTLFEELESEFQAQARDRQIELAFDTPPKYPVAFADRDKLVLAVHNVVGNAIKYTHSGGRVDVQVTADDERLEVSISDTGVGIPEDALPRIFERFYRVGGEDTEGVTGSGLGLALAREVVRLHGGEIQVESEVGRGSRFMITLPIVRRERSASESKAAA
ncbi:MAG: ATP-binding protein [Planctomycetota bacterium]